MNTMMQETLLSGTARKAEIPGWQAAGKTGTSQDFRDAWFIGYTSNLVTGVWLGNDDNSPTKKATGGGLPVEVWTRFMRAAHQNVQVAGLPSSDRGVFSGVASAIGASLSGQGSSATSAPAAATPTPSSQASLPPMPPGNINTGIRPPVTQTSARPEAASGLDGWLVDRLFSGKR
jgi:penicillin-binding protein 1A